MRSLENESVAPFLKDLVNCIEEEGELPLDESLSSNDSKCEVAVSPPFLGDDFSTTGSTILPKITICASLWHPCRTSVTAFSEGIEVEAEMALPSARSSDNSGFGSMDLGLVVGTLDAKRYGEPWTERDHLFHSFQVGN